MNSSSQVWAHRNLCCPIRAAYIPLMSAACARYFIKVEFSCCNMVLALIRCSVTCHTCPGLALATFVHSSAHRESYSAYILSIFLMSINSLGLLNSRSSTYFITLLILSQCFWHLAYCSWISQCGSRDILV